MDIGPQIALAVFSAIFGYANYRVIEKVNGKVRHGINGIFAASFIGYVAYIDGYMTGITLLFIARLFFDSVLNVSRFHEQGFYDALGYVPLNPTSWIDKGEKAIFGYNGQAPKFIYLVIIIVLNIFNSTQ